MKILVVSNLYVPYSTGGAEHVAELTVKGAQALGHEVVVLTAAPWQGWCSLWPRHDKEKGAAVYRYYPLNIYFYPNGAHKPSWLRLLWMIIDTFNLHSWLATRSMLQKEKPDVVITHNLRGIGYPTVRAAAQTKRHVQILHDVQLVEPSGLLSCDKNDWKIKRTDRRVYQFFARRIFGNVTQVVTPSNFLLQFYQSRKYFAHAKAQVVQNPAEMAERQQRSTKHYRVAYVGQLESQKGVPQLLAAWGNLEAHKAELHIVGKGTLSKEIIKVAEKNKSVIAHGYLSGETLQSFYDTIDLLVVPSVIVENSPVVIYEALARGVPVVASDVGGVAELLALSDESIVVEPDNVHALQDALRQKISTGKKRSARVAFLDAKQYTRALIDFIS